MVASKKSQSRKSAQQQAAARAELRLPVAAQRQLANTPGVEASAPPVGELLRELQVHQLELERQNEALRVSQLALLASRDRFVDFFELAPVGYLTLTDHGLIADINLTGASLLGVERRKLLQCPFSCFVIPEDAERWHLHLLSVLKRDEKLGCELALQRGDGVRFHARLDSLRLTKIGQPPTARIVFADVTERKLAEECLREQAQFFRLIAENIGDFIAVLDLEGRRLYNSPSYKRFVGATRDLRGTDSFAEVHPEDQERVKQVFRETVQTGIGRQIDYRFLAADGSIREMESHGSVIKDSNGRITRVVVVSHDVTERKLMEKRVEQLAFYDPLTKLPNRRLLDDRLRQIMAASARSACYGALMFLDLDNFKPLNDLYGHMVGDLLLIAASDRLKTCVRQVDTVARFGGDEFVVILSELDTDKAESLAQARSVAEKILSTMFEPYVLTIKHDEKEDATVAYRCTSSIGVVLFIGHDSSQGDILEWADAAMYQAKDAGRNLIRFHDEKAC